MPSARFRLGVAYRMRHDSGRARSGDFQRAVDAWTGALSRRQKQYIWRRRIQQYGPLLDKPYPFYPWVTEARQSIQRRDEHPITLRTGLSGAELLDPRSETKGTGSDTIPEAAEAAGERVTVDTAVVADSERRSVVRLHVGLRLAEGVRLASPVEAGVTFEATTLRNGPRTLRPALGRGNRFLSLWVECDVTLPAEGAPDALVGRAFVATDEGPLYVDFRAPLPRR